MTVALSVIGAAEAALFQDFAGLISLDEGFLVYGCGRCDGRGKDEGEEDKDL